MTSGGGESIQHDRSGEGVRTLTAADIAALVGGTVEGDPTVRVSAMAPIDRAGDGDLTFLASAKYATRALGSRASIVLVAPELAESVGERPARVLVAKPHEALLAVLPALYQPRPHPAGIDATARLGRGVVLGAGVSISAYAVIEAGARIGERAAIGAHAVVGTGVCVGVDSVLKAHVVLYPGTSLGARVVLHAGVRVGSDGFGYVYGDGAHQKIPHVGRCVIEDDVEIGANTTVDRGSIDDTVIGAGTKIDNLVHVAHNVRVGRLCLIMAQVGIAGSSRIGDGCVLAGQAGIGGHVTIGDGARIAGQAGVFGDVPAGESWSGYPARPHRESLRSHAALFKLTGMMKQIEKLLGGGA